MLLLSTELRTARLTRMNVTLLTLVCGHCSIAWLSVMLQARLEICLAFGVKVCTTQVIHMLLQLAVLVQNGIGFRTEWCFDGLQQKTCNCFLRGPSLKLQVRRRRQLYNVNATFAYLGRKDRWCMAVTFPFNQQERLHQ